MKAKLADPKLKGFNLKDFNDEELMAAYQKGDEGAFLVLYNRYAPKFYGYFQSRVKSRSQVDDLFQQAFLKLHKSRATYKPEFPFGPWAFTICRSVLIDGVRMPAIETTTTDYDLLPNDSGPRMKYPKLEEKLSSLSERERQAVEERYLNDSSFNEIAKQLNTTELNSRKIVSRALKKLRFGGGR